jgi:hypothetical protein
MALADEVMGGRAPRTIAGRGRNPSTGTRRRTGLNSGSPELPHVKINYSKCLTFPSL